MTLPVKPINEIEEKSEVSVNDKILILDSESEEARLASKDELKGDKWDQWDPWVDGKDGKDGKDWADWKDWADGAAATISVGTTSTWAAWTSASVTNSGTSSAAVFNFTIPKWDKWDQWVPWQNGQNWQDGQDGQDGADWNGITSVTSSKNWKTTTVTMNFDEWDPFSFQVQDWADWQGSWDMLTSVYDPNNKAADAFDYDNFINTPTLWTAASKDTWTSSWNVPVLDANWKLNTSVVPAVAITDTFTINSSSELTWLTTAEKWDIAICPSEWKTYILYDDPYSTAANWKLLPTPTDAVSSVNSKTWVVTLDADDISDSTTTNKFVTSTDITKLGNLSWVNTWDQSASDFDIKDLTDSTDLRTTWSGKQDALVNQSNIKSINWNSLLGSWDLTVSWLPSWWTTWQVVTKTASWAEWADPSGWIENVTTGTTTTVTGIRAWTETEYTNLSTKDEHTIYYTF